MWTASFSHPECREISEKSAKCSEKHRQYDFRTVLQLQHVVLILCYLFAPSNYSQPYEGIQEPAEAVCQ